MPSDTNDLFLTNPWAEKQRLSYLQNGSHAGSSVSSTLKSKTDI